MGKAEYTEVAPEEIGLSARALANIDRLQEQYLADDIHQGAVVLVARHGKVGYFKAFGKADENVPMQTDSIFRLASMSKVVAAVAVLQLWEQGRLALHAPISDHLPEFADMKVAVVRDWQEVHLETAARPITAHHLLTMTAGMTNTWWHGLFEPPIYHVVPKLYAEAGLMDDLNAPPITLEQNVKLLASLPLIAHPGEAFDYSNNSVDTLCRLVEVISGQDFDSYLRENVFEPLGMQETWFFPPAEERHRIAAVYWAGRDEKQVGTSPLGLGNLGPDYTFSEHQTYFSGAGGLHGTTADYFRFAQMLLNNGELDGVRVLSRAAVRLMTTNQIGDLRNWQLTQNKWGYQVDIQEGENAPAGSLHYLGGPGAYSWQGFFSTKFVNNPALDTVILTMSTPGFDGALPQNLRIVAAATAAVVD
ncbi:beta-lactamase family protein [Nakamurella flava]|uniref:Beta-lactamase family protein n=1 Tax=Nakamurella flava TaxID=2576308 RepID=A0A4U6QL57_9ACTN|nr:serine hydrolase domain-containing protein [Nakamurella flava]TKV61029.1 beta-lactamase family protein [Nakamurella flava]